MRGQLVVIAILLGIALGLLFSVNATLGRIEQHERNVDERLQLLVPVVPEQAEPQPGVMR